MSAQPDRVFTRAPLGHNVAALYALQIANYAIPLVTLPYLIRVLGPEHYGAMALAYAVVYFMVLFVDAGTNTLATRRLADPGIDRGQVSLVYATTQWIKLIQCVVMGGLLAALIHFVPAVGEASTLYIATFPIVLGSLLFPTWLFQGLEIMHFTTLCSVGGRLLATCGIFALVREPSDLVVAALLQASATALSGLLSLHLVVRRLGLSVFAPYRKVRGELLRTLAAVRTLAPAEFVTQAMHNCGVFVLGLFASDATVGVYAAVEKVARAAASLFQPLTRAVFPRIAAAWREPGAKARTRCRSWTRAIVAVAALVGAGLCLAAPLVLSVLFGAGWAEHGLLLRVLAAGVALGVCATCLGQFWLLARGRRAEYARCLLVAGLAQFAVSLLATRLWGVHGLVIAAALCELLRLGMFGLALRRPRMEKNACVS